jgi:hypothetical protein
VLPTGPLIETSLKTGPPNHPGNIASGEIATLPVVQEVLRSPGQPLDPATRAFMEPRFGHDFGLCVCIRMQRLPIPRAQCMRTRTPLVIT